MRSIIDSLEPRQCLAATGTNVVLYHDGTTTHGIFFDGSTVPFLATQLKVSKAGTLFISGTGKADTLVLQISKGKIVNAADLAIVGTSAGNGMTAVHLRVALAKLPPIKRVAIDTLSGDDRVTVLADVPVSVRTARGDDAIDVYAPTRTLEGGSGANTIRQGGTDDVVAIHGTSTFVPITGASPFEGPTFALPNVGDDAGDPDAGDDGGIVR